jgi:cyclic pyranopterin phosphate synthase
MDEKMTFLAREQVLSLEELALVAQAFTELGVDKIRFTGGEPLVRRGVQSLFDRVGRLPGLRDFCVTTNGSQLVTMAQPLKASGLHRINISLDSLKEDRFRELTRTGRLSKVLEGVDAAQAAGFKRIKLNAVILKGRNDDEILDLVRYAIRKKIDISFIEEMPLGVIHEHDRAESFCSSDEVRERIETAYNLRPLKTDSGGPAKYWAIENTETKVGFISPHSHNFCGECNRVRVTVEGRLLLCLGNEHSVDLKPILRSSDEPLEAVKQAIREAIHLKPEKHHFTHDGDVQIVRFMNTTGG